MSAKVFSEAQRAYMTAPSYQEVVELREFAPTRATDRDVSGDRHGAFGRSVAYDGWRRSLFPVEDLIVIDADGTHWVVEVKMDREMDTAVVKGKRDAARRWANYVTADETVRVTWRYLLASEADVDTARGSWPELKALGDA